MPELPEVETITRGLARRVTGDVIEAVWIGSRPQPLKSPAAEIASTLEGKRIVRIHRAGKHIVIDLENADPEKADLEKTDLEQGDLDQPDPKKVPRARASAPSRGAANPAKEPKARKGRAGLKRFSRKEAKFSANSPATAQWIVHLGMTGRLVVSDPKEESAKHTHLVAILASGRELRFIDSRMFGKLSVHSEIFDPGGIEPLEATEEQFLSLFRGRKTPIKSALLNQQLLRGVGNIYADESLFRAGIRPRRRASSLTREQLRKLYHAVQEVLREAIALGGSSISDYVDADGDEGFFQLQHRVYGREGEACLTCKTPIRRIVLTGRSSHYCPHCQK